MAWDAAAPGAPVAAAMGGGHYQHGQVGGTTTIWWQRLADCAPHQTPQAETDGQRRCMPNLRTGTTGAAWLACVVGAAGQGQVEVRALQPSR